MNQKKYLIYLDILGFKGLAEEIESKKGIEQRTVREKFIDVIKERVGIIEAKGKIIGKKYGQSDDWLLVTDALDKVFNCILEILNHNTGYKNYEKIPLEIAIGIGEYDRWAGFDGKDLIIEESTIKFYKTNIIGYYHKWYKKTHSHQSPKSSFIVLTESTYHELEPLDKKICQKIEYKKDGNKKQVIAFFVADVDKVQQRGRVFEFLEKIEYAGNKWYGRIDEVYVPPLEYEDIARTLKEKRIVFITGTQEYGKTYSAVRLLWEYYNQGYEPKWIKGGELTERIEVRKKLENIRAELKPRHIIYFEDPFGKTRYEKRVGLEREIGTIIDSAKRVEDVYIIVTSREEVFKEFEKEKLSAKNLKDFENKLNIKKPSYGYGKRKEILLNWAEEENCKWLGNKKLKELVLESIEDKKILPTPLSIRDFAVATAKIEKENELKEKIIEKSKETAKAFAQEIKNMTDDKILFLSFPFIYPFRVEEIRETYQKLVKELNLKDAWEFDRVLNWFKDDKIEKNFDRIRFSHSSYSEALEHLLVEDGYVTRINKHIFSQVLLKLCENTLTGPHAGFAIAVNFNKLSEDVRNSDKAAGWLGLAVEVRFNEIPDDVRNELLLVLSESDKLAATVASSASLYLDKLPEHVRNELLLKLSKKINTRVAHENILIQSLRSAVTRCFDELPKNLRNDLLLKVSDKDEVILHNANVLGWCNQYPNELPKEFCNRLRQYEDKVRRSWARRYWKGKKNTERG